MTLLQQEKKNPLFLKSLQESFELMKENGMAFRKKHDLAGTNGIRYSQESGTVQFTKEGVVQHEFYALPIGLAHPRTSIFKWSWAYPASYQHEVDVSEQLFEHGRTISPMFSRHYFKLDSLAEKNEIMNLACSVYHNRYIACHCFVEIIMNGMIYFVGIGDKVERN